MILLLDIGATATKARYFSLDAFVDKSWLQEGINFTIEREGTLDFPSLSQQEKERVSRVMLFAAGLSNQQTVQTLHNQLEKQFTNAKTFDLYKDIYASAFAFMHQKEDYLAIILGTGSNLIEVQSGLIVQEYVSGGFLLEDEGSGYAIGRNILRYYLHNQMPEADVTRFKNEYHQNKEDLIQAVYSHTKPNVYIASFSQFLNECTPVLRKEILKISMQPLIEKITYLYSSKERIRCNFTGSIAAVFEKEIKSLFRSSGLKPIEFMENPMQALKEKLMNNEL